MRARHSRWLVLLIGVGLNMVATSYAGSSVIETHRRAIQADLAKHGLEPKAYELSMLAKWDHKRLPIIVADPTQAYHEQRIAIYYAVLPDGTLVSAYDRPFERILATAYRGFSADDAKQVAQLSTIFGDFHAPVGFVTDFIRPGTVDTTALSRPEAKVYMKQDGGVTVLEFYSYQATNGRLYDCTARIKDASAELTAKLVPRRSAVN